MTPFAKPVTTISSGLPSVVTLAPLASVPIVRELLTEILDNLTSETFTASENFTVKLSSFTPSESVSEEVIESVVSIVGAAVS
ncbi:hypothetical protein, partial [Poseidonibacter ostreae]|uniref:hypothetical protein n=1 Tax=Poseidonibacter ostreae TaxID=2654171 RepID=UPI001D008325